jgi:starch synthase (maltosyl-transferring)
MPPIVYNLFPTLVGPLPEWVAHAERAREMGFNWLYVNPFHYPGFSGSLYAVKHHDRLHPLLDPAGSGSGLAPLQPVIRSIQRLGLPVMMDLVINHTAKDSPLVTAHPGWYRRDASGQVLSPWAMDPADATKITTWGDLAEIDNEDADDREGLWAFWEALVQRALDLGFGGFRCDAAYKVPASLWERLISRAKARDSSVTFVAETLGCRLEEVAALASAGFDYFYNSSKWWDSVEPWCLEQHEQFRTVAPSISFPESHDTPRLAMETDGSEAVQRQRYAFAAVFSAGLQITVGYEFGFRRSLDVVHTRPSDWEAKTFDLSAFIHRVNHLKQTHPLLATEGTLRAVETQMEDVTVLERWSDDTGTHRGLILINRHPTVAREVHVDATHLDDDIRLFRLGRDEAPGTGESLPDPVPLAPAEVALLAGGART